jgi:hypothetical protein
MGRILELPLTTTQDYTLFHILNEYSIDLWRTQLDAIEERHGLATLLVHPDYVIEQRTQALYNGLLDHVARMRERGAWVAVPGDVDRWWRQRSQMAIVREGDRFSIQGEGSERARLAFARLSGDSLALTVEGP